MKNEMPKDVKNNILIILRESFDISIEESHNAF